MPKLSEITPTVSNDAEYEADNSILIYEDDHPNNESGYDTPYDTDLPSYLMCKPYTLSVKEKINVWMKDADQQEPVDYDLLFAQWQGVYSYLASQSDVWQLPPWGSFQDQIYVSNVAMVMPHLDNMCVLANFKAVPRRGEEDVAEAFFRLMKFDICRPPVFWEGAAETKWLHDNVYIGGWGQRSDKRAYDWMEKHLDMDIIRVHMTDERLYHLDCSVFPLNGEKTIVCTSVYTPEEIKAIEAETEIVSVSKKCAYSAITNLVRVGTTLCAGSAIGSMSEKDKEYADEKKYIDTLTKIATDNGLGVSLFNISEACKSGAALSCMVLHMNIPSFGKDEIL